MIIKETKKALDFEVIFGNKRYQIATGGIHSIDEPGIFEEDENYYLLDCDISSMYPRLMLNERIKPAHLSDKFFDILENLTKERLEAKANGNKIKADALKITINSIYGKLGFEYYWLYDDQAMVSVCINGQLFILMLIERLVEAGFEIISANTDGILTKVSKLKVEEYYDICNEWMKETNFELEYANYKKYIRKDVNNYIAVDSKGKIKEKGDFITEVQLKKGYDMPIVAKALKAYFIDNQSVKEFILNHKDIYDFCKSQKAGGQFDIEFHYISKDKYGIPILKKDKLQKTNRYFVSSTGGCIMKKKDDSSYTSMAAGQTVTIFNNYYDSNNYNINYNYYISEANKVINKIKNNQLVMF